MCAVLTLLFVCVSVCGRIDAKLDGCVFVCVCVLDLAQSTGDNKEFVVGLEYPQRLELWQLLHFQFTDIALSCRSCRCCLRSHSGSTAVCPLASCALWVWNESEWMCICTCAVWGWTVKKRHHNPWWSLAKSSLVSVDGIADVWAIDVDRLSLIRLMLYFDFFPLLCMFGRQLVKYCKINTINH